jgi:hypothetical protein
MNGRSKYPWDRWHNGKWHTTVEGVDFHVPAFTFRASLYNKATSYGEKVKTRWIVDESIGKTIIQFCFYPRGWDGPNDPPPPYTPALARHTKVPEPAPVVRAPVPVEEYPPIERPAWMSNTGMQRLVEDLRPKPEPIEKDPPLREEYRTPGGYVPEKWGPPES